MTDQIKLGSVVNVTVTRGKKRDVFEAFVISHVETWKHGEFYVVQQRYAGDTEPRDSAPTHQCSFDEIEVV